MDFRNHPPSNTSTIAFLHAHAEEIYKTFDKMIEDAEERKEYEREKEVLSKRNLLCAMVIICLQKLPESEKHLQYWRDTLVLDPIQ